MKISDSYDVAVVFTVGSIKEGLSWLLRVIDIAGNCRRGLGGCSYDTVVDMEGVDDALDFKSKSNCSVPAVPVPA